MAGTRVPLSKDRRQVQGLSRAHSWEARAKQTQLTPGQHRFDRTGPPVHRCPFSINIRSALLIPGLTPSGSSSISHLWLESTTQMQASCVHPWPRLCATL